MIVVSPAFVLTPKNVFGIRCGSVGSKGINSIIKCIFNFIFVRVFLFVYNFMILCMDALRMIFSRLNDGKL